jgi:uncharacterized protein YndB with AHSA1/START domain
MPNYRFVTIWRVEAPLESVWREIKDSAAWNKWWRGVLSVKELKAGDADGVGAIFRSRWRSALPYTLEFDSEILRVERLRKIETRAFGELEGTGIWTFAAESENITGIQYDWRVQTTKTWMNILAPVGKPLFRWNHDKIMNWGAQGLAERLDCKLLETTDRIKNILNAETLRRKE